jgi:hypothetical protein
MDELNRSTAADDHDAVEMSNDSSNRHFSDVFASRFGRRDILKGGIGLAARTHPGRLRAETVTQASPGGNTRRFIYASLTTHQSKGDDRWMN